ncbi:hypothetical protein OPT61_g3456 [Boeremia exigua]|uniref:Uncharacterized protein n=1 Tax=Boeremia exigua TaxID=749465 RepID=A0ACC2II04_9PLEO|nr:hypothetical protein OPT61_g3456 [Boeremia exigua]
MLSCNTIDVAAWQGIERPRNFEGSPWQPLSRAELLGCRTMSEICAECDFNGRHNDSNRDDVYSAWVKCMSELWHENLDVRLTKRTGYGLFVRRPVPAKIFIGECTGVLVPIDSDLPDDTTVYQFGISIGKLQTNQNSPQPMCWVDATKKGSVFRFMAHSCEPNTEVVNARVGTHHRILAVRTLRPIRNNEPITIDYGQEWFTGEQYCLCGAEKCRNKP